LGLFKLIYSKEKKMISEVDLHDWQDSVKEGYAEFVASKGGEQAYGSEIWEAATHWAFEKFWEKLL